MEFRERLTRRAGRRFAFVVGGVLLVAGGLLGWLVHAALFAVAVPGGALLVGGILVPDRLGGPHRVWTIVVTAVARVTSPVVMGGVYFLVLTPIGGLLRVLGRNPLRPREHDGGFWMPATSCRSDDLENQF